MNDLRLVLLGNYYNTFSNKLSFYAASPSYLNIYIVFPSHQVGSLLHDIQYCFPIITYIIILYRQKKNQSKYKSKSPYTHFQASVPFFVIPSTIIEELIIASNLANRVLRFIYRVLRFLYLVLRFIYFILLLHNNFMKLLGD